jgi:hypothetical protein
MGTVYIEYVEEDIHGKSVPRLKHPLALEGSSSSKVVRKRMKETPGTSEAGQDSDLLGPI